MSQLEHTTPREPLFRLAHRPNPWAWPLWTYCRRSNRSRLGDEFTNWAIFERPDRDPVRDATAEDLRVDNADLLSTFELFGLTLVRGR